MTFQVGFTASTPTHKVIPDTVLLGGFLLATFSSPLFMRNILQYNSPTQSMMENNVLAEISGSLKPLVPPLFLLRFPSSPRFPSIEPRQNARRSQSFGVVLAGLNIYYLLLHRQETRGSPRVQGTMAAFSFAIHFALQLAQTALSFYQAVQEGTMQLHKVYQPNSPTPFIALYQYVLFSPQYTRYDRITASRTSPLCRHAKLQWSCDDAPDGLGQLERLWMCD